MTVMKRGAIAAALLAAAAATTASAQAQGVVEVRDGWRGGGVGIYIGPRYDYGYGGYYGYGPRSYGYYDDDDDYDRPYRKHSRRWTKERFEHPLGRK